MMNGDVPYEKEDVVPEMRLWNDNFCKICWEDYTVSHFNCGHIVHLQCQIKSGKTKCPECQQEIRVTRWMDRLTKAWQEYWMKDVESEEE